VGFFGDDNGSLEVAQGEDILAGFIVDGNVYDLKLNTSIVESLLSGLALHTCGFGVDDDAHCYPSLATTDSHHCD